MGRWAYLSQAVPVSGPMDSLSARLANIALGNTEEAPVIEFTYGAAGFKVDTPAVIAYAGEGAILKFGNQLLPANRPIFIPVDSIISLQNSSRGSRTYLAIVGGFDVPTVLNSYSTYLPAQIGGVNGRALQTGDVLTSKENLTALNKVLINSLSGEHIAYPNWSVSKSAMGLQNTNVIRVMAGPETSWFDSSSVDRMLTSGFILSQQSNRMGYRLKGPVIERINTSELLSTAVTMGTIQVSGNGELILLMADCQTTGGYPRIAQVASVDLPLCGQLKPGDQIFFKQISQAEAEMLYIEREQNLQKLAATLHARFL